MTTPSSIASYTTRTGTISPATACDARAPQSHPRIDHSALECKKLSASEALDPGRHHVGHRATSSRNARATSSESALEMARSDRAISWSRISCTALMRFIDAAMLVLFKRHEASLQHGKSSFGLNQHFHRT